MSIVHWLWWGGRPPDDQGFGPTWFTATLDDAGPAPAWFAATLEDERWA